MMEPRFSDKDVKDDLLLSLSIVLLRSDMLLDPNDTYLSWAMLRYCLDPSNIDTSVLQAAVLTVTMGSYSNMVKSE